MLDHGAEAVSFETIVAAGPHSAIPHHSPTDRPIGAGDLLKIDFGALSPATTPTRPARSSSAPSPSRGSASSTPWCAGAQQAGVDALGRRAPTC